MGQLGVRAFAKRNNIDIHSITGSGKDGRVTKEDLLNQKTSGTKEDLLNQNTSGTKARSTPAVRAFAKQQNVDIN